MDFTKTAALAMDWVNIVSKARIVREATIAKRYGRIVSQRVS